MEKKLRHDSGVDKGGGDRECQDRLLARNFFTPRQSEKREGFREQEEDGVGEN